MTISITIVYAAEKNKVFSFLITFSFLKRF